MLRPKSSKFLNLAGGDGCRLLRETKANEVRGDATLYLAVRVA